MVWWAESGQTAVEASDKDQEGASKQTPLCWRLLSVAGLWNKHLCSKKMFWNLASEAQEWVDKQALQRVKSQSQSTAPSRHRFALLHRSHRICCWKSVCRGSLWHENVHKRIGFHFDEG